MDLDLSQLCRGSCVARSPCVTHADHWFSRNTGGVHEDLLVFERRWVLAFGQPVRQPLLSRAPCEQPAPDSRLREEPATQSRPRARTCNPKGVRDTHSAILDALSRAVRHALVRLAWHSHGDSPGLLAVPSLFGHLVSVDPAILPRATAYDHRPQCRGSDARRRHLLPHLYHNEFTGPARGCLTAERNTEYRQPSIQRGEMQCRWLGSHSARVLP